MSSTTSVSSARSAPARNRILFSLIALLSLAGVIVSAISVERHFATSASGFCDFNQKFDCDVVNRSEYSSIVGIPVAAVGVAGYALLFVFSVFWKTRAETPTRLLAAAVAGFAFALFLTYIEAYKLEIWCILCLSSQALISVITVLALAVKISSTRT